MMYDSSELILALLPAMLWPGALGLVCYIFGSLGIYGMSRRLDTATPGLAFVPFARHYALGRMAEYYDDGTGKRPARYRILLLVFSIISAVLSCVTIGLVLAVVIASVASSGVFDDWNSLLHYSSYDYDLLGGRDYDYYFNGADALVGLIVPLILCALALAVFEILFVVFRYIALYRVFKIFSPDNATLFLVLSILFSVTEPFFLFALRNRTPVIRSSFAYGGMPYAAPYPQQNFYAPYGQPQAPQQPPYAQPVSQPQNPYVQNAQPNPQPQAPQSPHSDTPPQDPNA